MATYRRNLVLINKPFQFRFAIYVCSWLVALSFIYPLIVYNLFDYFIRFAASDPNGPSLAGLKQTRSEVIWLLALTQVAFLGMTFLISLFMSHRIAGPLHKLRAGFEEVKKGNFDFSLHFRKKDHFSELAEHFNEVVDSVRTQSTQKKEAMHLAIAQIERAVGHVDSDGKRELESAIESLRRCLASPSK